MKPEEIKPAQKPELFYAFFLSFLRNIIAFSYGTPQRIGVAFWLVICTVLNGLGLEICFRYNSFNCHGKSRNPT
jgi:hypothetical protein